MVNLAYAFLGLLSDSSPLAGLADYSVVIQFLFSFDNPSTTFDAVVVPTAGKLQMKLYSKGKSSCRMRLWSKWRDSSLIGMNCVLPQQKLASDLVHIGDGLILPGDDDWKNPSPGAEDHTSVKGRRKLPIFTLNLDNLVPLLKG